MPLIFVAVGDLQCFSS